MIEGGPAIALPRREKVALLAFALATRAVAAAAAPGTPRFGDAAAYVRAARLLWTTGTYPAWTDLFLFRPPGYPAFLALSTWGHPERIGWDRAANVLLGSFAVLVLAAIAGRAARSLVAARVAGAAAAVYPPFLLLSAEPQSEPLFLLLYLAAGFLLLAAVDRPSSGCAVAAGASLALAALTRPSALPMAALLAAPLFDRRFPPRVRRSIAGSALFGFCVVLLPWTARNALRFGGFLPVSDGGAFVFWQGNSPSAVAYYRARTPAETDRWTRAFGEELARLPAEIPGSASASPVVRARAFSRAARGWIAAHPRAETDLLRRKAGDWLRPWADPRFHPRRVVLLSAAAYPALALLAAAGLLVASRRGVATAALAVLAVSMAVHVATIVALRYRAVYWDPVLIVYASAAIAFPLREAE